MKDTGDKRFFKPLLAFAVLVGLILLGCGGFAMWALAAQGATSLALDALQPDDNLAVLQDGWIAFIPKAEATVQNDNPSEADQPSQVGFILYPGARVDARAYAPLVREIAKAGHVSVIVPMPLNLAFFDVHAADRVRSAFPMVKRWVIAGHSLGGAMAGQYVADSLSSKTPAPAPEGAKPSSLAGLVLFGAFVTVDLRQAGDFPVLSVAGSVDGLSTPAKIQANAKNLPGKTHFVEIAGANHAQFGSYGDQSGDNPASISPQSQRAATVAATLGFLDALP